MGAYKNSRSRITALEAKPPQTPHVPTPQLPFRNADLPPALLQPFIPPTSPSTPEFLIENPRLDFEPRPTKQSPTLTSNRERMAFSQFDFPALVAAHHYSAKRPRRLFRWEPPASAGGAGLQSSEKAPPMKTGFSPGIFRLLAIPAGKKRSLARRKVSNFQSSRVTHHRIPNRNSRFTENHLSPATAIHTHFLTATKQHFPSNSNIAPAPLLANRQHDNFQFHRDLAPSNMPSNINNSPSASRQRNAINSSAATEPVYWRVEGSLLNLTAVRPVGFFTWNAQTFLERWGRREAMGVLAIARPFLYATNRVFATRLLHTVLRGVSRDRLDLLGEEFFQYFLKPRLKAAGVARLKEIIASGADVVLVSQGLDHIMRPLANHLGVERILCNRLDFRDGLATGRLLDPVIRPRGAFAKLRGDQSDGRIPRERLLRDLAFKKSSAELEDAIRPAERLAPKVVVPTVHFGGRNGVGDFSLRESLKGKQI